MKDQQYAALYFHENVLNITLDSIDHGLGKSVDIYLEQNFRIHHGSLSDRVRHAMCIH